MAKNDSSTPAWVIILILSMLFAISLAFITKDYVRKASAREAQNIEIQLGVSTLERVNELASRWYGQTFQKLDINSIDGLMADNDDIRDMEQKFLDEHEEISEWAYERKEALLDLAYWVMRRVALFLIWLPRWIAPAAFALIYGFKVREIKKTDFGYTSPVLNNWARSVMALSTFLTLLMFLIPVPVDPIVFFFLMIVWSAAIAVAVANIQKRI